jgi:hypothetical protein
MTSAENMRPNETLDKNVIIQLEKKFKEYQQGHAIDVSDIVSSIVNCEMFGLEWLNQQIKLLEKPFRVVKIENALCLIG